MLAEFKKFLLRGNLIDLAIAFIIGLAFANVVQSFVDDVVFPFIAAIGGKPNFDAVKFDVGDGEVRIGSFITVLVTFVIIAAACFLIFKAAERLQRLRRTNPVEAPAPEPTEDILLLTEIRDLLARR